MRITTVVATFIIAGMAMMHGAQTATQAQAPATGSTDQTGKSASQPVVTSDWPQWRGPNRDSISPETGLALDWNAQPPREMWTAEVGDGFGSVVVVGSRAFAVGWSSNQGGEDTVWCFDAETGSVLWKYTQPNYSLLSPDHGLPEPKTLQGSMATPCVDGDRIYVSTLPGKACCLRTDTGEVLWERNLLLETGADPSAVGNGNAASPLVIGDIVVFGVGSIGTGVDKLTGKIRWGWTGGGHTIASPMRIPVDGVDYVTGVSVDIAGGAMMAGGLHLLNAANGKELRTLSYPPSRYPTDPLLIDGNLLLSYELYSIKSGQKIWQTKPGAFAPPIACNGFLYQGDQEGRLYCIDIKDGSVKCEGKIPNYGTFIMAQGKLLILDDGKGAIHVAQASPEAIKLECNLKLPGDGQGYYTLPSISDGRLFVRGQIGKVTVYDIRAPEHPRYAKERGVVGATEPAPQNPAPVPPPKPTDQDWPGWRGPQRDGIAPANDLKLDWTKGQPSQLWQTNAGPAFSGLAMAGDRIYTMGYSYGWRWYYGGSGTPWARICCIDARNGQMIWDRNYGLPRTPEFMTPDLPLKIYGGFPFWDCNRFYFGCRATPALDGDRLYALDQTGIATCLNAADGSIIWQKNLAKELELAFPVWYFGGSPLVLDKVVVLAVGTAGVALDKESGRVVWSTGKDACGCASPMPFSQGGQQRLAMFGKDQLYTLAADVGTILWKYNWVDGYGRNMSDPVPVGEDQFLVCGAKGKGSALLKVGSDKPVWEQKALDPLMGTPVLYQGYVYGPSQSQKGVVCLDAKTGKVQWTSEPMAATQVILSGETLVIQCLNGELRLAKASPQGYKPLGKCHPLQSEKCFTPPVVAHGKLLCRSWEGDIVALDLATLEPVRAPVVTPLTAERMTKSVSQLGAPTKAERQAAIDVLAQAHDAELTRLLPVLIATFKSDSWFAQDAAGQVLQQLGAKAKPVAADLAALASSNIKTHDWAMVAILLETLKKVDPASLEQVSPAIQAAIGDADKDVRIPAIQFLDRVPLTEGLLDAVFTQAKDKDNYFRLGCVIRRIGRMGPAVSEKLLPKFLPSLEQVGEPGMLDWGTTLSVLRDLGPGAQKALPALLSFAAQKTGHWENMYSDLALKCIKLRENSDYDPLQNYVYVNTPPSVKDMQLTCVEGTTVTAKMDCNAPDDFERNLVIILATQPAHGKVSLKNLGIEYQADNDYVGKDAFTWRAADPTDESGPATVTIQVTAENVSNPK